MTLSRDRLARVEPVRDMDRVSGVYLLKSHSSLHIFDLDTGAYLRLPGERSNTFPHDVAVLRLTRVERWPEVGGDPFFIWLDDPREYAVMEYWRQSSTISAMYRVRNGTGLEADARMGPSAPGTPISESGPSPGGRGMDDAFEEFLPGLHIQLDSVWTVLTSPSDLLVDQGGTELERPSVLQWPFRRDHARETALTVYRASSGLGMRLRLDVLHGDDRGPRSTSGICQIRLVHGEPPAASLPETPTPGIGSTP